MTRPFRRNAPIVPRATIHSPPADVLRRIRTAINPHAVAGGLGAALATLERYQNVTPNMVRRAAGYRFPPNVGRVA
jgi:hypothetical protein